MANAMFYQMKKGLTILSDKKIPLSLLKDPRCLLAFGFGSGYSPIAPGTIGTIAALPLYIFLMAELSLVPYLIICAVSFVIGCYLCDVASKALGVHDHGGIVWDEFVGYWIAMIAAPQGLVWVLVGFVLFRLFDIWKPYPISALDAHVHGGFGIMLDDLVAGLYALLGVQLLAYFFY